MMRIATWNVNSLKVRLPQVLQWLGMQQPQVLCLQELKMENSAFPLTALEEAGYHAVFNGQKTYNGVAILSLKPPKAVCCDLPDLCDPQKRLIAASIDDIRVVCAYFPNGEALDSDKFQYKLRWLQTLTSWLEAELIRFPQLVLAGDFNIAPQAGDAHPQWQGGILVSEPERHAFQRLCALGLCDAFRLFDQPENSYSCWDYRMGAFRRNFGLRIDHLLVSTPLRPLCSRCEIDKIPRKWERPSDHAPVILSLKQTPTNPTPATDVGV